MMNPALSTDLLDERTRWATPLISRYNGSRFACGTAFFLAWGVALTAWHNIKPLIEEVGGNLDTTRPRGGGHRTNVQIETIQFVNHLQFVEWRVLQVHQCRFSPDIAILRLEPTHELPLDLHVLRATIDPTPPTVGERVTAFGYAASEIGIRDAPEGFVPLGHDPRQSAGETLHVYREFRDRGMLNFPCFAVDADFSHGMSGGPIVNARGYVCGIVSAGGFDPEVGREVSYGASLLPILGERVQWPGFNAGEAFDFLQLFVHPLDTGETVGRIVNAERVRLALRKDGTVEQVKWLHDNAH
jgi:Trypsin-like peptidase domain